MGKPAHAHGGRETSRVSPTPYAEAHRCRITRAKEGRGRGILASCPLLLRATLKWHLGCVDSSSVSFLSTWEGQEACIVCSQGLWARLG
eukprot:scaffold121420_cov28-Tisochrysis_lutea.AAC.5